MHRTPFVGPIWAHGSLCGSVDGHPKATQQKQTHEGHCAEDIAVKTVPSNVSSASWGGEKVGVTKRLNRKSCLTCCGLLFENRPAV